MCNSTLSSNFAKAASLTSLTPSSGVYAFSGSTFSTAARYFFPCVGMQVSAPHRDAHAAGGALDHAHGGLYVVGVEVFHLDLGDLPHFGAWNRARRGATSRATAFVGTRGLLDQVGRRGCLGHEAERAVLVDRDQGRDDRARLSRGPFVVLLQESHHVDAVLAKRRADRRRGRGFASRQLERDDRAN